MVKTRESREGNGIVSKPSRAGQEVRRFELSQSIKDAPLTRHPETGEKIRRSLALGPDPFVRAATLERRQPQSVKRPKRQETHDPHGHDHDHHHH